MTSDLLIALYVGLSVPVFGAGIERPDDLMQTGTTLGQFGLRT
jgi:hypothetical protein